MEEMLIEKVRQLIFLYDTKSPDYRYRHMRAKAWEGIGKELKIKRKFYVSSRDVRIVCPRLNFLSMTAAATSQCSVACFDTCELSSDASCCDNLRKINTCSACH
jgi:hypothetical protein